MRAWPSISARTRYRIKLLDVAHMEHASVRGSERETIKLRKMALKINTAQAVMQFQ